MITDAGNGLDDASEPECGLVASTGSAVVLEHSQQRAPCLRVILSTLCSQPRTCTASLQALRGCPQQQAEPPLAMFRRSSLRGLPPAGEVPEEWEGEEEIPFTALQAPALSGEHRQARRRLSVR